MILLGDLILLRPGFLLLLPLLPLLLWWTSRRPPTQADWAPICDPALQSVALVDRRTSAVSRGHLLASVGWFVACLAMAGPAWERQQLPQAQSQAARVLIVELSPAMWAVDLAPNRVTRVRMRLHDLLDRLPPGHTALVVYADDAFVAAPLTDDVETLRGHVDALDPSLMPVSGQRAERGLRQAAQLLRQAGHRDGDLLLIGSGEPDPKLLATAAELRREGLRTAIWVIASHDGGPVLRADGSLLRLSDGSLRVSRPDLEAMATVARAGGGIVQQLDAGDRDLENLLGWLSSGQMLDGENLLTEQLWLDRGPWLVLLLLPLAALAFRRGVMLAVPLAVLLAPPPLHAANWRDWLESHDRRAARALLNGDAETAAGLARDPEWAGAAAFRQGDHQGAATAFRAAGSHPRARYNLGNALAAGGDYAAAIEAWEQVLAADPAHEDARANLEAVRDWLAQQSPQAAAPDRNQDPEASAAPPDSDPQPDDAAQPDSGESPTNADQQAQRDAGEQDQRDSGSDSDGSEQHTDPSPRDADPAQHEALAEALRDAIDAATPEDAEGARQESTPDPATEEREALENWLRRVPDDPGGLLRAKFLLEHQRRLQHARNGGER